MALVGTTMPIGQDLTENSDDGRASSILGLPPLLRLTKRRMCTTTRAWYGKRDNRSRRARRRSRWTPPCPSRPRSELRHLLEPLGRQVEGTDDLRFAPGIEGRVVGLSRGREEVVRNRRRLASASQLHALPERQRPHVDRPRRAPRHLAHEVEIGIRRMVDAGDEGRAPHAVSDEASRLASISSTERTPHSAIARSTSS